ncbi:hypothetical protein A3A60_02700 [Candidatus Curtissbacteria bacterium RIFCSPLOWO2_01_FULL_42_26]|uniref:Solute-binding protein family 5 domain-containing protein n=1 Tax=Candidatus Curtissbacteria bacterium RIFCSPLOWO2_01_FULL_42_26 TaxID=1797729 RepID=A0A1F5I3K6_9BACT|nr:MAG: hypothetical protein A3A60_02700 [Candidatus Curtissbacteria bacterium RIFCSPLOWO2_01_FULL_42_26]
MFKTKAKIRQIKFWWHLIGAYIARYKLRLISLFLVIIIVIVLAIKIWPLVTRSNVVSIGYVGSYTIENIPSLVLSLATNSLISYDESGKPAASLASNWTVSDDGKTYIVFLKDNLRWHDYSAVTAQSISIAITDVEINAINNKTLEFKLPNPISSFPQTLTRPVFKADTFYGTGEFRIIKISQVGSVVKKILLHSPNHQLPKVEIKFYPSEQQLLEAIKIGEVKSATILDLQELDTWPNLSIEKSQDNSQIVTIFINNSDGLLSSKELRQALAYAIDKSALDGHLANGPIPPNNWAYNTSIKNYDYNLAKAKELIKKSEAKNIKITLSTTSELKEVAKNIQKNWQDIGIEVEIKEEKNVPENFQALLAIDKLSPDPDQYSLWHSTQIGTNITNYKNVKIDKLLEDARATSDEKARKQLYEDFQKFLVEDEPAIFLYHPYRYKVTYKNAQDLLSKLPKM